MFGPTEAAAVWPRNAAAVDLIRRCPHSWRRHAWNGRPLGLDYPGLLAAAQWMGLDICDDLWMRVQWLEAEMLRLLPAPCNEDGME